jgi:copper homeostasis protein
MYRLEVIATTLQEAIDAQAGGASSVEIIEDLSVGGITPPLDIVRAIRDAVTIDMNVMVRPHARTFVYSAQDIELIFKQTEAWAQIGVSSVVFGALAPNGEIDFALTAQVASIAKRITFHRALDETKDPTQSLEYLKNVATRILCSGGAPNIWLGRAQMGQWVKQFPEFTFACAGGVTLENLPELVRITQAQEYHVGSAARTKGVVDREKVRIIAETLAAAH